MGCFRMQTDMKRWLVLLFFLFLIVLGFYSRVLHVREAGGTIASVGGWLPPRPTRTAAHLPSLGAPQIVVIFVTLLFLWAVFHQGPKGRFRN